MGATRKKTTAVSSGTVSLLFVWRLRLSLRAEGATLRAEGDTLWAKGDKLWAEGATLWAKGDKLWAEGIIEAYGNVMVWWVSAEECVVKNVTYRKEHP